MTTINETTTRIPTPRNAPADAWQAVAYMDFLYGFGAGPGLDLGGPREYGRIPSAGGCVYRQDYDEGVALCNFGDDTADVLLEHPYYDIDGTLQMGVGIAPHAVVVLRRRAQ